jgi:hypothetical protein
LAVLAIHCGAEMKTTGNVFILDIYDRYIIVVLNICLQEGENEGEL